MDITFRCTRCGEDVVVDEARAGSTIDCPKCRKPVYVPSQRASSPLDPPAGAAAIPPSSRPPAGKKMTPAVPALKGAIVCQIIGGVLLVAATILALTGHSAVTGLLCFLGVPFLIASFLCAVYAICQGRIKPGVALVAAVSILLTLPAISLLFGVAQTKSPALGPAEELQKQLEQLQKMLGS